MTKHLFILLLFLFACTPKIVQEVSENPPSISPEEVQAQKEEAMRRFLAQEIGFNPNVIHDTLENGLQYYILENEKPENKVELRLILNAGSINEEDDEQGLAHFLEHMLFNGTENFENELVDYLQSVGVQFGAHLNAYTSFDETVYMLSLPVEDSTVLEKGFQVLDDWAGGALLHGDEIDKERGVVLEEYRIGLGADKRMLAEYLPKVLPESKYIRRLPIGNESILKNFQHETLRDFYNEWYRPNLMAVAVVGDIDTTWVKEKIEQHFGNLTNPPFQRERLIYKVPNHRNPYVAVVTDSEAPYGMVRFYIKEVGSPKPKETFGDYKDNLLKGLFSTMLNQRLSEKLNEANPPFIFASVYYGQTWARTKDAYQGLAVVGPGGHMNALKVMMEENERVERFGFLPSEFERAKQALLSGYERSYNERDKSESSQLIGEMVRNFLEKEPMPGIEWEYHFVNEILPTITLEEVNALVTNLLIPENRVFVLTGPEPVEGTSMPTEEEVLSLVSEIENGEIEEYIEESIAESILPQEPVAGEIVSKTSNPDLGLVHLTLSNGAKVTYKVTDFKNDEVLFRAISKGGSNAIPLEDYQNTSRALGMIPNGGIYGFDNSKLDKFLQGKNVRVSPYLSSVSEGIRGTTTPKNLSTMLELVNAYFTGIDFNEEAYQSEIAKSLQFYSNLDSNPQNYFSKIVSETIYGEDPRFTSWPTEEDYSNTDFKKAYELFKERFDNAADFHFYFVGNIEEEELEALVAKYIGSLPGETGKKEEIGNDDFRVNWDQLEDLTVKKGQDQKSLVQIRFSGETEYDSKEDFLMSGLGEVLSIKLLEVLREEKSGVYGVGANGGLSQYPYGTYSFSISFPCGPENVEPLTKAALDELNKIIADGPTQKDIDKVKESIIKEHDVNLKSNGYWLSALVNDDFYERESGGFLKTKEKAEQFLTVDNLKNIAQKYLKKEPFIAILLPEE